MTAASSRTVFDHLAPDYDASFSDRLPARWLRQKVRSRVAPLLAHDARVLDVGCGTGEDALWFGAQGHSVLAIDLSERMLELTRKRRSAAHPDVRARISVARADAGNANDLSRQLEGFFDLVHSNFGALNCIADLRPFFAQIAAHVQQEGTVALTLMGRFCAWESAGFVLRGDFKRASRRWRGRSSYELDGACQEVFYYSPATVRQMAVPYFTVEAIYAVGFLIPSTEFFNLGERWPSFFNGLSKAEDRIARLWPCNRMSDHYLIILKRSSR